MSILVSSSCWSLRQALKLHSEQFQQLYGREVEMDFRDQMKEAASVGGAACLMVWIQAIEDVLRTALPETLRRIRLLAASGSVTGLLTASVLFGFCTFRPLRPVQGTFVGRVFAAEKVDAQSWSRMVPVSAGHRMFLECSIRGAAGPTVLLVTGRGLGTADAWSPVQSRVQEFASVCSFDALGAGKSDPFPGAHQVGRVVANMHDLFTNAALQQPYLLVGASAGGVVVRRYQQTYPRGVGGLVFVDSSHEEQEWRDAAIAKEFDPQWDDPGFLTGNGMLSQGEKLRWHANIPLIVLERTELPPCAAFPGLTQTQCDGINAEWHSFQIDLAARSKYGKLVAVAGSGHAMQQQKPEAIAQAIHEVLAEMKR